MFVCVCDVHVCRLVVVVIYLLVLLWMLVLLTLMSLTSTFVLMLEYR